MNRDSKQRLSLSTRNQSQEIDSRSQTEAGISGLDLMNEAGEKAARFLESHLLPRLSGEDILILVGPGNNGGDALVVARELAAKGLSQITIWTFFDQRSELQENQWSTLDRFGFDIEKFQATSSQRDLLEQVSLVIDGIFGVGLDRELEGDVAQAMNWLNDGVHPVVSLDVPTGLHADTGRVLGVCLEAQWTLCFGLTKPGFYIWDGPRVCGEIQCIELGFDQALTEQIASTHYLFDGHSASACLPRRKDHSNKSHHGTTHIVAGSDGMWGAALLASQGAFRAGSGYVRVLNQDSMAELFMKTPETMTQQFHKASDLPMKNHFVVGPGLGIGERSKEIIEELLHRKTSHVVIDADALTTLTSMKIEKLPSSWVLTPHTGEMSRLIDIPSEEIEKDRFHAVRVCQQKFGCHILLKGFRSIVFDGNEFVVIHSGNSSLATAGAGDVLAGVIGGFFAQGLEGMDGICTGAYVHGLTSDIWVERGNARNSMMASDIIDLLPKAIQQTMDEK